MPLTGGSRLGAYEIVGLLGAGGMGEVYRARDERLRREVAITVLPAAFSADPDRLARFEQEARAAAALDHPNIIAVHDLGRHDGAPFIVTELLEGAALRDALGGGALPVRKAPEEVRTSTARALFPDTFIASPNGSTGYSVARDGRFLFARAVSSDPPTTSVQIVLNWVSELRAAVAAAK